MSDLGLLQLFLRMRVFSHFAAVHRQVLRYATDHDELSAGFRKHDPWVADYVRGDYKTKSNRGHVSLAIVPRAFFEKFTKGEPIQYLGSYDPINDIQMIPEPKDPSEHKEVMKGISHELWHGAFDKDGPNEGILSHPSYRGPSRDEIKEYAIGKTSGHEFGSLKDRLKVAEETVRFNSAFDFFVTAYGQPFARFASALTALSEEIKGKDSLEAMLSPDESQILENNFSVMQNALGNFRDAFNGEYKTIEAWAKEPIEGKDGRSNKDVFAGISGSCCLLGSRAAVFRGKNFTQVA